MDWPADWALPNWRHVTIAAADCHAFRIIDILRHGHPYTYVDLDLDDTSRNLLDRFSIAVSEIPIVIGNGTYPSEQRTCRTASFDGGLEL
jgi:hypothetical protein